MAARVAPRRNPINPTVLLEVACGIAAPVKVEAQNGETTGRQLQRQLAEGAVEANILLAHGVAQDNGGGTRRLLLRAVVAAVERSLRPKIERLNDRVGAANAQLLSPNTSLAANV